MSLPQATYRSLTYLKHNFTAWNTGGEGIHSPSLFYLVRMLMCDKNTYYVWRDIESIRQELLSSSMRVGVEDYGTGVTGNRWVKHIAQQSLEIPKVAQLLFRWVLYLSATTKRSLNIIELGTSLGVTTAYIAAANKKNQVYSFEGAGELVKLAKQNWQRLGLNNIHTIQGNIDDTLRPTLYNIARETQPITHENNEPKPSPMVDIAFVDANHRKEPTLRYWNELQKWSTPHSIYIFDDIHHSREMEQAWNIIRKSEQVTTSMDLYHVGVVFFDPHYLHKHYRLRL